MRFCLELLFAPKTHAENAPLQTGERMHMATTPLERVPFSAGQMKVSLPPRCFDVHSGVAAPLRPAGVAEDAPVLARALPSGELRSDSSRCMRTSFVPAVVTFKS